MTEVYDAVVVGARCAGAATAMLLARAGHRVLLLDAARFPADTLSTLYIHSAGVDLLAEWGLLRQVVASGCPAIPRMYQRVCDVEVSGPVGVAYAPRRRVLDQILVDGAVEAGAEFRDRSRVRELLRTGGRVGGVTFTGPDGAPVEARATLVIGADGMRSTVADRAGATITAQAPTATCVHFSYWQDVPGRVPGGDREAELYEQPGSHVSAFPTHDGRTIVASYLPQASFPGARTDALATHLATIRGTAPELAARLDRATRVDRLYGSGDQRNFFRTAAGPGWALAGDAAHHKDSISARGITDAVRQAGLLASLLEDALLDPADLDAALTSYAAGHEPLLDDSYRATLSHAALQATDRRLEMLRRTAADPALTATYLEVLSGRRPLDALAGAAEGGYPPDRGGPRTGEQSAGHRAL